MLRQMRCCVDFWNLNKACPKDEFPLPNMDMLIDSTVGHAIFSFMDGFSGYNQIRCHLRMQPRPPSGLLLGISTILSCPLASTTPAPLTKEPWPRSFMIWCTKKLKTRWMTMWWSQKQGKTIFLTWVESLKDVAFTSFVWTPSSVLLVFPLESFWVSLFTNEG